jgi:hypothetical protein
MAKQVMVQGRRVLSTQERQRTEQPDRASRIGARLAMEPQRRVSELFGIEPYVAKHLAPIVDSTCLNQRCLHLVYYQRR